LGKFEFVTVTDIGIISHTQTQHVIVSLSVLSGELIGVL